MCPAQIDILLLSGPEIHRFFTGLFGLWVGSAIWLVIQQAGEPVFVAPRISALEIQARCKTPVALEWVDCDEEPAAPMCHQDAVAAYIKKVAPDAMTIGIDFETTSGSDIELMRGALGARNVCDATPILQDLVAIKDEKAIADTRRAAQVCSRQFYDVFDKLKPGVEEWEIVSAAVKAGIETNVQLLKGDIETPRFTPSQLFTMGSGPERTARCLGSGGGRRMEDGELMQLSLSGQTYRGNPICFERTFHVGEKPLSKELLKIVNFAKRAQKAALDTIRDGVKASDVHAAAVAVINEGGWKNPYLHGTGRGAGPSGFDGIELNAGSEAVLRKNMILRVQPGIYVNGIGGARYGDTVLVTADGHEMLTSYHCGREI